MTTACQLVTDLTAALIDRVPQEEGTRRSPRDPEAKIAGGP